MFVLTDSRIRRRWLIAAAVPVFVVVFATCADVVSPPTDVSLTVNGTPDYVITSVDTSVTEPLTDLSTLSFHVRVANRGDSDERPTAVSMYVDGQYTQEVRIAGLKARADTTVAVPWKARAGTHQIVFGVDKPPVDTTFIPEKNEANNADTVSILIPYGNRQIVVQDTLQFSDLPTATLNDSLVQQVLDVAADSGQSVGPANVMIRTRYAEDGVTTYFAPLGSLATPVSSGAVLTIVTDTAGYTIPYILDSVDGTEFVMYNSQGGARFKKVGASTQVSLINAQSSICQEGGNWPCVAQLGGDVLASCAQDLYEIGQIITIGDIIHVLAMDGCGTAFPAFPGNKDNLRDDPPVWALIGFIGEACEECREGGMLRWHKRGYVFYVRDDRGPVVYRSSRIWTSGCLSSSYPFSAEASGGFLLTVTVTVNPRPSSGFLWPTNSCPGPPGGGGHSQGGGG